jgi:hypothetical protein
MAETIKLKQQDKTLNKLAKSLQKRLDEALMVEKQKTKYSETLKQQLAI